MSFLPSSHERKEHPGAFAYECTVSAKCECAGALCLYEWGLHVLVRGHVRHMGWELYFKKDELEKMKQESVNGINLSHGAPSSLLPTATVRHTCFIKINSWLCK